ncbi:MAG: YqaA family protein [Alphaproteobacteria bacterium]
MNDKRSKIFQKILEICSRKKSRFVLYLISFFESIFFPVPTDPFLIPYILAENKFLRLAINVTFFSVLGGIITYMIGTILWDNIFPIMINYFPNISNHIENFQEDFYEFGYLMIIIGGFSPFPFKVTCLASGILNINFIIFIILSGLSRGIRFILISYLIYKYGRSSISFIKKNILLITLLIILISVIILYLR